ncbi:MAG: LuxR C-terminal-related transcriptional regulator, partial [Raoultibacter sp.]
TTSRYHLSSIVVFGFGWGLMVAGGLAGTFIGGLLTSFVDLTPRLLSLIALLSVCALLFAYLFLFNERSVVELTVEGSEDPGGARPFRRRCEEVAETYKLSAKETEVMILVAKGRSTPRICDELDISQGTVNTHLTHIYKKLDVHDKQELIDVLEGRRDKR